MTAIAYRDGIMAADSVGWKGGHIIVPVPPKIWAPKQGGLIGCAGASNEIHQFREWMRGLNEAPDKFDKDERFEAIWVKPDRSIWHCWHTLKWTPMPETTHFIPIGAEVSFMYGALHAGATAEQTVRLTIEHTDGAYGRVQVEYLLSMAEAAD